MSNPHIRCHSYSVTDPEPFPLFDWDEDDLPNTDVILYLQRPDLHDGSECGCRGQR